MIIPDRTFRIDPKIFGGAWSFNPNAPGYYQVTDGFADALDAYARDPDLRRRHGEAGLAYAATMDWDEINASVLRVYESVIERRRP